MELSIKYSLYMPTQSLGKGLSSRKHLCQCKMGAMSKIHIYIIKVTLFDYKYL